MEILNFGFRHIVPFLDANLGISPTLFQLCVIAQDGRKPTCRRPAQHLPDLYSP